MTPANPASEPVADPAVVDVAARSVSEPDPGSWTNALRERLVRVVPPGQVLPDRQPVYVASWIYVFGVLTLAAMAVVIVSGGDPLARWGGLVACLQCRPLRQQLAPVER